MDQKKVNIIYLALKAFNDTLNWQRQCNKSIAPPISLTQAVEDMVIRAQLGFVARVSVIEANAMASFGMRVREEIWAGRHHFNAGYRLVTVKPDVPNVEVAFTQTYNIAHWKLVASYPVELLDADFGENRVFLIQIVSCTNQEIETAMDFGDFDHA